MRVITSLSLFLGILILSSPAYAYIGPAIAFVSYLMGPVVAIIAALAMVLYFPLRIYMKKRKKKKAAEPKESNSDSE